MIALERGRLPQPYGAAIDRSRAIEFTFEGKRYSGYDGDTVASALWAAGVRILARSFKYKRPRGIFSLTGFDGGLLVQAGDEPNRPADRLRIAAGMPPVAAQNYAGSLERDLDAWTGAFSRFLPVGFYYRSFFRPRGAWDVFEPLIRKHGGLGRLYPGHAHAPQSDKQYLFCDVAVVGAGPAGLAAAAAAARRGADVLLVECDPALGGSARLAGPDPSIGALIAEVERSPNVRILTGATAQGLYADNWLSIETERRLYKVRAVRVVVAAGAFEQPLIFRNNDLPGVMLAGAARRLMRDFGVAPGRRAVVATVNDDGLAAAFDLLDAGVEVAAVVDGRDERGSAHGELEERGVTVFTSTAIYEALPAPAPLGAYFGAPLAAVKLARVGSGGARPFGEAIPCDVLCVAGGYAPAAALLCHAGARLAYDDAQQTLVVDGLPANVGAAGAVRGVYTLEAVADGTAAGEAAASGAGFGPPPSGRRPPATPAGAPTTRVIPHPRGKEFVDLDEDLTVADIGNAIADGFTHVELLKRYSTGGMGPSQGKFAALATLRVAAQSLGVAASTLGTTTARPPFTGQSVRLLAGKGFAPYRVTPMHARHRELGAQMMQAGTWYRPAYYGPREAQDEAIAREVRAVRTNAGMIDVSTLGGIELSGPDAAAFLDRMYATPHLKQPVGRSRYVLLCEEGGAVVDDGVACRLGEQRFYVTATTSAVDQTYRKMLWLNAQWHMRVDILNVTSAFAAINVAGPRARDVVSRLASDVDFSAAAFRYLDVRTGTLAGIPARIVRVGFVGELGYEIHVPTPSGARLWDALIEAGRETGIVPFGVEAQRVLRLEKAHVIVGQDTDGLTHPYEAGLEWAIGKGKREYLGKTAIEAQRDAGLTRKLVGFTLEDATLPPPPECCLVVRGGAIAGRVTSATRSLACGGVIGLAYVAPADERPGSALAIKLPAGGTLAARVVATPFYDPANTRQEL